MRIKSLSLSDYPPIKHLEMDSLGNTVVIAGANGSGKTRLKEAIVSTLQSKPVMDIEIEATRPDEEQKYFGEKFVKLTKGQKNPKLQNYINSRKYGGGRYVGSVVQIDSTRSVQSLHYSPVNWLGGDPDDVEAAGTYYFTPFSDRWQNFVNYIHQKAAARDKKLAETLKKEPDKIGSEILDKLPDPFKKYQKIFAETLPGKELLDIDPASPKEFQFRDSNGSTLPFNRLSSGEQEVIKILFDVARKDIRHSVIIVDEPELHLHPTLAFQLIESLKNIGEHSNQYFFLTHSSDLISTYYATGDVYFIESDQTGQNQAHRLSDLSHKHGELISLVGQNLGMFAVGKKLVFVEGEDSSIDRLTYQKVAQTIDPEVKVIPSGSVQNVLALNSIEQQIRSSIFGVDLYMVRDRDGLTDSQINTLQSQGRIRCLKRRHIENYFLDSEILSLVAKRLYLGENLDSQFIQDEIFKIAEKAVGFTLYKSFNEYLAANHRLSMPSVKAVQKKNLQEIVEEILSAVEENVKDLAESLKRETLSSWLQNEAAELQSSLSNGNWLVRFQGKYVFSLVCGEILKEDQLRIRNAYVDIALEKKPEALKDIMDLFLGM